MESVLTLTEKEAAVLKACYSSDFYSGDGRPDVWTFSVEVPGMNDHAKAGVLASLKAKGVVALCRDEHNDVVTVTHLGHDEAIRLGFYSDLDVVPPGV